MSAWWAASERIVRVNPSAEATEVGPRGLTPVRIRFGLAGDFLTAPKSEVSDDIAVSDWRWVIVHRSRGPHPPPATPYKFRP
jgi:hypothetical protein